MDGAKAAEQLAAERALKAIEASDNLRKEVDTERESLVLPRRRKWIC